MRAAYGNLACEQAYVCDCETALVLMMVDKDAVASRTPRDCYRIVVVSILKVFVVVEIPAGILLRRRDLDGPQHGIRLVVAGVNVAAEGKVRRGGELDVPPMLERRSEGSDEDQASGHELMFLHIEARDHPGVSLPLLCRLSRCPTRRYELMFPDSW